MINLTRALILAPALLAATVPAQAGETRDLLTETLSARLFPLLSQFGANLALPTRQATDALRPVLVARRARADACAGDPACLARAALWSEAEIVAVTRALAPTRFADIPDDGVAAEAARELRGLDGIIRVYALGEAPHYPAIDGPGDLPPAERDARLKAAIALRDTPRAGSAQRFDRSIEFALALLEANDRTDAAGFEPIAAGLNAPAMLRAAGLDWRRYRYGAIILTGVGPEMPDVPLSAAGTYHVRLAANRFADGDAAFVIVSGGRAHPHATRFAEAVEMRRALVERYRVPAEAIVIEPYARHTTTNLRNAARRLAMLGAPAGKDALIVSNPDQSRYIEGAAFAARNMRELGYQPGTIGARLSPTELVFRPAPASLRVDPADPLDP